MALTKVSLVADGVILVSNLHPSHGITTDNIGEGSNKYYSNTLVQNFLTSNNYVTSNDVASTLTTGAYFTGVTHDTVGNLLTFTKSDATTEQVNLTQYIDDTNLARLVSGTINASTGIATFTRDDSSTFTVDFSSLLDDTNDYVSSAAFNTSDGVLTLTRFGGGTVIVDLDGRYLQSFTETDPIYTASSWYTTTNNASDWDTAYGWGNHAAAGYLTSFTETDPTVPSHVKSISTTNISNWNTAYGWGNHADAGYLTSVSWGSVSDKPSTFPPSSHNHDDRYYTEAEADGRFINASGDTMNGTLTLSSISGTDQVVENTYGAYLHLGAWAVGRTDATAVLVNTAYRADYADSLFNMNISRFTNDSGYLTSYTETDTLNSVTGRGSTTSNTIQVGKLGIGRGAASNESISVENPEGTWLIQGFRSGTSVGGLHTNGGVLHVQAADVRIEASSSATWNGDIIATRPWVASQGYLTSVTNISGYAGELIRTDNRTISPSELGSGRMSFGFTSWNNNSTGPWADFIHLRGYTDNSGGSDNLITFLKSGIGMRIWQQTYGSSSPYSSYVDVITSGNIGSQVITLTDSGYYRGSPSYGFRFNNNADTINSLIVDNSGNSIAYSSHRAPIFYDSNDTGRYLNPNGFSNTGFTRIVGDWASSGVHPEQLTVRGTYASIAQRATQGTQAYVLHHVDDQWSLYVGRGSTDGTDWNWAMRAKPSQDGNYVDFRTSARAPIFYDYNDTAYYVDPNSTSNLNALNVGGSSVWTSGNDGAGSGLDADLLDGRQLDGSTGINERLFNNQGRAHSTYTDFNSTDLRSGVNFLQGGTNGPTGTASHQFYGFRLGLGSDYSTVTGNSGHYASELYWARQAQGGGGYLWARDMESGSWGSWRKMNAGDSDSLAGLTRAQSGANVVLNTASDGYLYINNWIHPANGTGLFYDSGPHFHESGATMYSTHTLRSAASLRAPIFYDENDTSYYLDPNSTNKSGILRSYLQFNDYGAGVVGTYDSYRYQLVFAMGDSYKGALNGTNVNSGYGIWWSHPNAGGVAGNLDDHAPMVIVNGTWRASLSGSTRAAYDMRAPIFYDLNNTAYYADPNGTSNLNAINAGSVDATTLYGDDIYTTSGWFRNHTNSNGIYWSNTGWHLYPADVNDFYFRSGATESTIRFLRSDGATLGYLHCASDLTMGFLTNGRSWRFRTDNSGNSTASSSMRAPIFYDSDNTAYYVDPASTSNISKMDIGGYDGSNMANLRIKQGAAYSGVKALDIQGVSFGAAAEISHPYGCTGLTIRNTHTSSGTAIAFTHTGYAYGFVGSITTTSSSTTYATSSDYRLKENLTPITDGIDRVKLLQPKRFNFISEPNKVVDGFVAHEAQEVVPEAVTGEKDAIGWDGNPEYQGIDQSKLVPLLTAALQEAIAKIESLESRIETLENA